ncbi:MAG TPA: MMPL family transporter [Solirubrobacteraceae bacterium]|jgi:RND superfamily putative drug exporter
MLALARWCTTHRRRVAAIWIVAAIAVSVIAQGVGRNYANNFSLPGTESQQALNLLLKRFQSQSGDLDQIVWQVKGGSVKTAEVKEAIEPLLAEVSHMPHVVEVVSPYSSAGKGQISKDGSTAFASVSYAKRANLLPATTGKRVLNAIEGVHAKGLKIAAGGQVIEQAEQSGVGFATAVGVIAALLVLMLTFGSLLTAGMPLATAGLGLVIGVGAIGLLTHVLSVTNIAPDVALMIGLGVGVDYALFIVTRFRQAYARHHDVEAAVLEAMDTSGRAIVLAGTTVIIALLGMFTVGVSFLNGIAVTAAVTVTLVLLASLTVLPALLSRFGERVAHGGRLAQRRAQRRLAAAEAQLQPANGAPQSASGARSLRSDGDERSLWRRWSILVQAHPWLSLVVSLGVMIAVALPLTAMRLDSGDASNDPVGHSTYKAYEMLASGFGQGFNGPLSVVVELRGANETASLARLSDKLRSTPDVAAVLPAELSPARDTAVIRVYPSSSPEALATTELVNHLREDVIPPLERESGTKVLVGGFTAGSIDFSRVLTSKLPLFIAVVVALSALLLLVIFRSLVIPLQAAVMNMLSIGGALGVLTAIFQWGWLGSLVGVRGGPIEPWLPVFMFAIVFGLSMDYEVFLISRVHEEWTRSRDPSRAVLDGLSFTGRVITAAAAIMILVFLSFVLGDERAIKEFGLALASAVLLDAVIVRCLMLPALLQLLGKATWYLPRWLDRLLPRVSIEGSLAQEPEEAPHRDGVGSGEPATELA